MTTTVNLNRGEVAQIPFTITDTANGLVGKRVTWSVAAAANGPRLLRKEGGLPGSTAAITISTQVAGSITGFINILAADFNVLTGEAYVASLWTDDGAGGDHCVTLGGYDNLVISPNVARAA